LIVIRIVWTIYSFKVEKILMAICFLPLVSGFLQLLTGCLLLIGLSVGNSIWNFQVKN